MKLLFKHNILTDIRKHSHCCTSFVASETDTDYANSACQAHLSVLKTSSYKKHLVICKMFEAVFWKLSLMRPFPEVAILLVMQG